MVNLANPLITEINIKENQAPCHHHHYDFFLRCAVCRLLLELPK